MGVRPFGEVEKYHMGMELRIGPVIRLAGWPRRKVIESGANDVGADDTLAAVTLMSGGVFFNFAKRSLYGVPVSLDEPVIAAHQRLDAYRFGCAEDAVPACRVLAIGMGRYQHRAAVGVQPLQQSREIIAADNAGQTKFRGRFTYPSSDAGLTLRVIVVLGVMFAEILLSATRIECAR